MKTLFTILACIALVVSIASAVVVAPTSSFAAVLLAFGIGGLALETLVDIYRSKTL